VEGALPALGDGERARHLVIMCAPTRWSIGRSLLDSAPIPYLVRMSSRPSLPVRKKKTGVFGLAWVLCWIAVLIGMWVTDVTPANPEWWRATAHPGWWWLMEPQWFFISVSVLALVVAGIASWTVQRTRVVLWNRKGKKILSELQKNLEAAIEEEEARRR